MNKKSIAALALAATMTVGVGASYAWFTSQATSTANTFEAGKLTVDFDGGSAATKWTGFEVKNLQPGVNQADLAVNQKVVTIKNTGSLPLNYYVRATLNDKDSTWEGEKQHSLSDVLWSRVTDENGDVVFNGPVKFLTNVSGESLSPSATKSYRFSFYLPGETTSNFYQGLTTYVNFEINAAQTNVDPIISSGKLYKDGNDRLQLDFTLNKTIDLSKSSGDIQIAYGKMDGDKFVAALRTNGTPIIKSRIWGGYLNDKNSIKYSTGSDSPTLSNVLTAQQYATTVDPKFETMNYSNDSNFLNTVMNGNAAVRITVIDNSGNIQTTIVRQ